MAGPTTPSILFDGSLFSRLVDAGEEVDASVGGGDPLLQLFHEIGYQVFFVPVGGDVVSGDIDRRMVDDMDLSGTGKESLRRPYVEAAEDAAGDDGSFKSQGQADGA